MQTSESVDQLYPALISALSEMPNVRKDFVAVVETKGGGSYSYNYAGLPEVLGIAKPILAAHGLALVQSALAKGDRAGVVTRIIHVSGQWIESDECAMPIPAPGTAQAVGSAITYARRYSATAMVGMAADEDDDGQLASTRTPPVPQRQPEEGPAPMQPALRPVATGPTPTRSSAPPEAPPRPADREGLITGDQVQMLWIETRKAGLSKDDVHRMIHRLYGAESTKDLTFDDARRFIEQTVQVNANTLWIERDSHGDSIGFTFYDPYSGLDEPF